MPQKALRVAWTGPLGHEGGPAFSASLATAMAERGVELDIFGQSREQLVPALASTVGGVHPVDIHWNWDRWYSRNMVAAFATSAVARLEAYRRTVALIRAEHARRPYDVWFQMSQPETFLTDAQRRALPPLVVHPCTSAAGELRGLRNEARLRRRAEPATTRAFATGYQSLRRVTQGREVRRADLVIGPSHRFVELLSEDYGLPLDRTMVLRHPVNADLYRPAAAPLPIDGPVRLLYVARLAVRKGFEMVTALSHRLTDLAGAVQIDVYGGKTMWSDYTALASELHPAVAAHRGRLSGAEMAAEYQRAHGLLLPSHYEPGALVVSEALSCGLAVVLSDEVGPGEVLPALVSRRHADGDLDAMEREVRGLVADLRDPVRQRDIWETAQRVAAEQFSLQRIGDELVAGLERFVADRAPSR